MYILMSKEYLIEIDGKNYPFDFHPYMGPLMLAGKNGPPKQLGNRHKFWTAVSLWAQQGKEIGPDGRCVWKEPPDPFEGAIHIGGRNWMMPKKTP
jgi:hypothetical protein